MLSYTDQTRIAQEVVLGVAAPKDEGQEAADFRAKVAAQAKEAMDAGIMPNLPLDWEAGEE